MGSHERKKPDGDGSTIETLPVAYLPIFHVNVAPTLVPKIGGVHGMSLFLHK